MGYISPNMSLRTHLNCLHLYFITTAAQWLYLEVGYMKCQPLAISAPLWIQTPQHVSMSVTIVLATFPRLFGHFLESLIAIIFFLQLAKGLEKNN